MIYYPRDKLLSNFLSSRQNFNVVLFMRNPMKNQHVFQRKYVLIICDNNTHIFGYCQSLRVFFVVVNVVVKLRSLIQIHEEF